MPRIALPRVAIFGAAVTCGVLAAMAVQILLGRAGIELASVWRNLFSAQAMQLRTAGGWWLIAGAALVTSALVAAALDLLPLPWVGLRGPRWGLGAVIVFALAEVGHAATAPAGGSPGIQLAVNLTAFGIALLMAVVGAFFTVRR